jgi:hypothetical protein
MLAAEASYFCSPTPSGASAVKTFPQRLQRNRSSLIKLIHVIADFKERYA